MKAYPTAAAALWAASAPVRAAALLLVAGMLVLAGLCVSGCSASPFGSAGASKPPLDGRRQVSLRLTSPAFVSEERLRAGDIGTSEIPARHAMTTLPGGRNVSIPYVWRGVPAGTKSLALALVDAAPVAHDWVHWLVVDISAETTSIPEGASGTPQMPAGAIELRNTFGFGGYGGPQPPAGTGRHPYVATLYALDVANVDVPRTATLAEYQRAIAGHVLASDTCTGRFGR